MKTNQKETIELASLVLYAGLLFISVFLIAKLGIGMWEEVGNAYMREISTISGL
jgi:hypothetical protein